MPQKLILIDGSNQVWRAYHAIQADMRAPDGFPTRALYGFCRMLLKIVRDQRPDFVAVTFDLGKGFRYDLYPEYKAKRNDMPEDLAQQWPELVPLVEAFGFKAIMKDGAEADDILGTLAWTHASPDVDVYILSGDKDFCQLVSPHIRLLDLQRNVEMGPDEVQEKWGVPPERMVDLLSLMGDSSDNIPGIPGVGPKKAAQFLTKFGDLEGVLNAGTKIGGKTGQKVIDHAEDAWLARTLVTIQNDPEFQIPLSDMIPRPQDRQALAEKLTRFDFQVLLDDLGLEKDEEAAADVRPTRSAVEVVERFDAQGPNDVPALLKSARNEGRVGVAITDAAIGMSIDPYFSEHTGIGLPRTPEVMEGLRPLFEDPDIEKVTHHAKRLTQVLAEHDITLRGVAGDTVLLDYVCAVDKDHHLDSMSLRYLGHNLGGGQQGDLFADKRKIAAEAAYITLLIEDNADLREAEQVYRDIELPLTPILHEMETRGIKVDTAALGNLSTEFEGRIAALVANIHEVAGREFNVNSTRQLAELLFTERGHEGKKKTKSGFSTDSATLEGLRGSGDPLPVLILDYRSLNKLKTTYVDALPQAVADDGRIHTHLQQAVANTGRLSSNDPNLQNIPARTEEGRRIRSCFIPDPGFVFLSADYSQIELRVLAHFCGEGALVEAFEQKQDIHQRTASEIFGVGLDEVTHEQRTASKAINFGLIYGMSAFRLSRDLGIPRAEAQKYINSYFERYPEVKGYMDGAIADARRKGYAETRFGRRRAVENLTSRNFVDRGAAERIAMNTPIQGTAADIIKLAMVRVDNRLKAAFPDARLLLQVHDELLLEVPPDQAEQVRMAVVEEMRQADDLIVPLVVEAGIASNWADAH